MKVARDHLLPPRVAKGEAYRCLGLTPSPALRSLGEAGWEKVGEARMRALYVRASNASSIASHTAFRPVNTSMFQTRNTTHPRSSKNLVRFSSWRTSLSVPCVAPSTSTTTLRSRQAKSAKYGPIGNCRTNLKPLSLRPRSSSHKRRSASVSPLRRVRARLRDISVCWATWVRRMGLGNPLADLRKNPHLSGLPANR